MRALRTGGGGFSSRSQATDMRVVTSMRRDSQKREGKTSLYKRNTPTSLFNFGVNQASTRIISKYVIFPVIKCVIIGNYINLSLKIEVLVPF